MRTSDGLAAAGALPVHADAAVRAGRMSMAAVSSSSCCLVDFLDVLALRFFIDPWITYKEKCDTSRERGRSGRGEVAEGAEGSSVPRFGGVDGGASSIRRGRWRRGWFGGGEVESAAGES